MRPIPFAAIAVSLICAFCAPLRAAEVDYTLAIAGFRVGTMHLQTQAGSGGYDVGLVVTSAGAVQVFRPFSFRASAQGALRGVRLMPGHYVEEADTGRRQSAAELAYAAGVPRVMRYTSPRELAADTPAPATQGGTLDPASALFAVLGDWPHGTVCGHTRVLFDGARRSHVALGPEQEEDGTVVCRGEYRRLQGFTPEELSRHVAFPVKVVFAPLPDGRLRAVRVEVQSVYGLATVVRR